MVKNTQLGYMLILLSLVIFSCRKDAVVSSTDGTRILAAPYSTTSSPTSGELLIMDGSGNLILQRTLPAAGLDFKKWTINGKIRYTYIEYDAAAYHIANVGYVAGSVVILDENMNELKRVRLLPNNGRTASDVDVLDGHDFILLDDDHYISMAYYEKEVNNIPAALNPSTGVKVVADIIQEVQNGVVVWEWDATDYPELYSASLEGNTFSSLTRTWDYLHMNSMFIDPNDNNLICSFRNTDQVLKLNRTTGDIMWRLGGSNSDFLLPSDQVFHRQHNATITDNGKTLLLFDNGLSGTREYSRIAEFQLNENGKVITGYKSLNLPDGLFCRYMGSVQKIGSSYFIGCGSEPQFMELNNTSGAVIMSKTLSNNSYRAYRYLD